MNCCSAISNYYSMASLINNDVKNTNTYAWINPSNISKYKLNGIGKIAGIMILSNSITTNAPNTLPKSRIHRDNGLINISNTFKGATTATGSAKLLAQRFTPFAWIPDYSIRIILMIASAPVTFKSFVGGFMPNNPIILDIPMYTITVTR